MATKDDHVIKMKEDEYQPLANSITEELESLLPLNSACCIFTVPDRLRSVKEKAYTPRAISIGPLHHGKQEHFKAMEEHKKRYLQDFLGRTNASVVHFVKIIKEKENLLRSCYTEPLDEFKSEEFVKIMLIDGSFIIEVLTRHSSPQIQDENDRIFNKPYSIQDIWSDLLLLENQLPFFLLEDLYGLHKLAVSSTSTNARLSIIKLFYDFVSPLRIKANEETLEGISISEVEHFVDLLRKLYIPLNPSVSRELLKVNVPTITELHQAGVRFKRRESSVNILDIHFNNGILEIPKMLINRNVERVWSNVLAFEKCYCYEEKAYFTDYVTFLDSIFDTAEDVNLLEKYGILEIWGDGKEIADLINNLSDEGDVRFDKFYFARISDEMNRYCRVPWHNWKAILKTKYFNSPWAIISVIAAVILLILTVIQTVCSILSVDRWPV